MIRRREICTKETGTALNVINTALSVIDERLGNKDKDGRREVGAGSER